MRFYQKGMTTISNIQKSLLKRKNSTSQTLFKMACCSILLPISFATSATPTGALVPFNGTSLQSNISTPFTTEDSLINSKLFNQPIVSPNETIAKAAIEEPNQNHPVFALKDQAERGDTQASYALAKIYMSGDGEDKNLDTARYFFEKSAEFSPKEQFKFARFCRTYDTLDADTMLKKAADNGSPDAAVKMAMLFHKTGHVDEARRYWEKALANRRKFNFSSPVLALRLGLYSDEKVQEKISHSLMSHFIITSADREVNKTITKGCQNNDSNTVNIALALIQSTDHDDHTLGWELMKAAAEDHYTAMLLMAERYLKKQHIFKALSYIITANKIPSEQQLLEFLDTVVVVVDNQSRLKPKLSFVTSNPSEIYSNGIEMCVQHLKSEGKQKEANAIKQGMLDDNKESQLELAQYLIEAIAKDNKEPDVLLKALDTLLYNIIKNDENSAYAAKARIMIANTYSNPSIRLTNKFAAAFHLISAQSNQNLTQEQQKNIEEMKRTLQVKSTLQTDSFDALFFLLQASANGDPKASEQLKADKGIGLISRIMVTNLSGGWYLGLGILSEIAGSEKRAMRYYQKAAQTQPSMAQFFIEGKY